MSAPEDPVNFIPADVFFPSFYKSPLTQRPQVILSVKSSESQKASDPLRFAADITFQGTSAGSGQNTHCLIQFVTPQIWRIRYDPTLSEQHQYSDENTRTIVQNSFANLVDNLQQEYRDSDAHNGYTDKTEWYWKTEFKQEATGHWILTSVDFPSPGAAGRINTRLHIFSDPFKIIATRNLELIDTSEENYSPVGLPQTVEQIIWQSAKNAFSYQLDTNIDIIKNVVMSIQKPGSAKYLGFGEQGGRTVLKKPTFMNFFCFDNYNYRKVYGTGALDPKEPLYHSTPFYLEMNRSPGFRNVTGLMVDNYSQVALDLGKTNAGTIAIGTRFGTLDAYVMTANDVPKLIWQYTSMVGRPKLKPRFVLGHHQGCYGYDSSAKVAAVADSYRKSQIPLDGMHLDVDLQDRYRTFTVNPKGFPNIADLLKSLRSKGIKSCTNITPILTLRESDTDQYETLRSFWNEKDKLNASSNLLVNDKRYLPGLPYNYPKCTRYDLGDSDPKGIPKPSYLDPNDLNSRISFSDSIGGAVYRDDYIFHESDPNKPPGNYNSGFPFHGGVSYGQNLGTPGYYPDLNRAVARKTWGEQYQKLFDLGLEFIWQDMTTPAAGNCYGDMLGFPSRLLISEDSYNEDSHQFPPTKTAIEQWSLYSYNLHKATYHGLNALRGRENKRNFIIGRGSQTGMHRYAGLWTGDNGSSWDFWRISVTQVLALGYSGITVAGPDMGGFTKDPNPYNTLKWCEPELLIRWYSGAFLLPWYRNHYQGHFGEKDFQEPWNYTPAQYRQNVPIDQRILYASVEPMCRYFVQLRYTLIQVLYDAMFANLTNGLPIARSMLITDPDDTSLFNEGSDFIDNQYLLGSQILVCPIMDPGTYTRDVYLPQTDAWFPSNLRVNVDGFGSDSLQHAAALSDPIAGGSTISYYCPIPDAIKNKDQMAYSVPVYIRAGK
ncbi:hypothetical protein PVAG01_07450 [Phlyctema vagabunda]|uniref:alpha-glucosidase n=1 Tax=Phlyctema vagabunda TaxID=108571 RepID=A0ABR4PCF5_9HELO